jgi:alanyl-tRNA synthetase
MQHHSATHLLNSALHQLLPSTYQRSSHVTPDYLTFDFAITGKQKLDLEDINFLENYVNNLIKSGLKIERKLIPITNLPSEAVLIPGELYPEEVFILSISDQDKIVSIEPCCGTHCKNTGDIQSFCIVSEKSSGTGVRSLRALAGSKATMARQEAKKLEEELTLLEKYDRQELKSQDLLEVKLQQVKLKLMNTELPLIQKQSLTSRLSVLEKQVGALKF